MTYAVLWSAGRDGIHAGRLALAQQALVLEGAIRGTPTRHELRYDDICSVEIARAPGERLRGRPVAVLDTVDGETIRIAVLDGAGLLGELVDKVDTARDHQPPPLQATA